MRTRRPAPPLPLRAFGSRTAISSAQKTSPRGGQPKGGGLSLARAKRPLLTHPVLWELSDLRNLNLLSLEKNEKNVEGGS